MDPLDEKQVKDAVQKILDEMINPAIAGHGGWVDLLDVKENNVYLRLGGGCGAGPAARRRPLPPAFGPSPPALPPDRLEWGPLRNAPGGRPRPMDEKDINEDIKAKVQKILDEMINPAVAGHGGWVDLLDVKENMVYLRLGGGCQGCGMVNVTLKQGIEATLREEIPQIAGVIDQTDHAGGTNPYYQPSK